MRALVVALVGAVFLGACVDPLPGSCALDSDCRADQFCDVEVGACFLIPEEGLCEPACAAHQQCDFRTCEARYSGLSFVDPTPSGAQPGAEITVRAALAVAEGKTANLPASLSLTVKDPAGATNAVELPQVGDAFEGKVTVGTAEGTYSLTASYAAAGLEARRDVRVDSTPPSLVVEIVPITRPQPSNGTTWTDSEPGYENAHRFDERMEIRVTSTDDDLDPASVAVKFKLGATAEIAVPVSAADNCPGTPAFCAMGGVDLWTLDLKAFRETIAVTADGSDLSGNAAAQATDDGAVTRLKWIYERSGNPEVLGAPAIANDGTLFFGTKSGSSSGHLVAIAADGTFKWDKSVGAVTGSPSVGAMGRIYVGGNDSSGAGLHAFAPDGSAVNATVCRPSETGTVNAGIALHYTKRSAETQTVETATAVVSSTGATHSVLSLRPGGSPACLSNLSDYAADATSAVAAVGSDVYYGDTSGNVVGFAFGSAGWVIKGGWPSNAGLFTRALAVTGSDIVGAGGGPSKGGLFAIPQDGAPAPDWQTQTSSPAWTPVIDSSGRALVGLTNGSLLAATVRSTDSAATFTGTGALQAAPLVGAGGWIYVTRMNAQLDALRADALGTPLWSVAFGGTQGFAASPTIDCSRMLDGTPRAGIPGVLYATSNEGRIYAVVVDSRGIDVDAPWPKYQHDPRNTGSPETSLGEFVCP